MADHAVLDSAEWISQQSVHVSIPEAGVKDCAAQLLQAWKAGGFKLSLWRQEELNPHDANDEAMDWIFVVDTLNFSFWASSPETLAKINYNGKDHTGYWSLCAAINRALQEGIPITSPDFLSQISLQQVKHIFRTSNGAEVPLLSQRQTVLQELGQVVLEKFGGSFSNIISKANNSAKKLIELMTTNFSSYRDEALWDDRKVYFHKRVQILVADLWACFEGQGHGKFDDIDHITMFADYRVPQSLVALGALQYDDQLTAFLNTDLELFPGDKNEMEIRANSIWSVELIKREMLRLLALQDTKETADPINSIVIDFYLWTYAKQFSEKMKHVPIHKIRTIFY